MPITAETFRTKSPLIQKVRATIRALRMSPRTEDAYVHWIVVFIMHFGGQRNPVEIGASEVSEFLSWMATEKKCAAATVKVAEAAILFYYKHCNEKPS